MSTKFLTNEYGNVLEDRLNEILLNKIKHFDILVGYFKSSGFYKIYDSLEDVDEVRILMGLNSNNIMELTSYIGDQQTIISSKEIRNIYTNNAIKDLENSEDSLIVEKGIQQFIEYVENKKIKIRVYPYKDIQAKLYIMTEGNSQENIGKLITGSSNFTSDKLVEQLEFNIELDSRSDIGFAKYRFNQLWDDAIDVSDCYLEVAKKSWMREDITPYELYLKCLYEYFKEEINQDKVSDMGLGIPDDFMKLEYQLHAVIRAEKILETYNGVFISDVVGLGKTYICAMLMKRLRGKKLVICPPTLKSNWERILLEFDVAARVESGGKIDTIVEEDLNQYKYIFIDEAHRYRNDNSKTYAKLHEICKGKKIVLISATPYNNGINDIKGLIGLFQDLGNSNIIPNQSNLDSVFQKWTKQLTNVQNVYGRESIEYRKKSQEISKELRQLILNNIMVRRTRNEIKKYYSKDLEAKGLTFPTLNTPRRIVYQYKNRQNEIFDETVDILLNMTYARYIPFLYLKNPNPGTNRRLIGQHNIKAFMKNVLMKRLESSFYAFKESIKRFIDIYEKFIVMYKNGAIYVGNNYDIYKLIDSGDFENLDELTASNKLTKIKIELFKDSFLEDLNYDLLALKKIESLWREDCVANETDPKLLACTNELKVNKLLKNNKIIIFTESKDTANFVYEYILNNIETKTVLFTGNSNETLREIIKKNFNPDESVNEQKDDFRILITTDVLSEGISLHRANTVINYDLPWNPTRVMQRVGRINRVGTEFPEIFVYNFFPSDNVRTHLTLEENVTTKIQAFHNILGEDCKYLTEYEEINNYNIFGEQLYDKLNSKDSLIEDVDEISEDLTLKYLNVIRDIRDNDIELYMKIKQLPKKIRCAKHLNQKGTLTFLRDGTSKKFFLSKNSVSNELDFYDAIKLLESDENVKGYKISESYYSNLSTNKKHYMNSINRNSVNTIIRKSSANTNEIIKSLNQAKKDKTLTDLDLKHIDVLIQIFNNGVLPANLIKTIKLKISKIGNFIERYNVIWDSIPTKYLEYVNTRKLTDVNNDAAEIVLSLDLI